MEAIRKGHERPVDRVAARMLWKAPWWATYPESAKPAVLTCQEELPASVWIDYTKGPPSSAAWEVKDRRGWVLEFGQDKRRGTIIGYAHGERAVEAEPASKPAWYVGSRVGWNEWSKQHGKAHPVVHCWWVLMDDGTRSLLRWKTGKRTWAIISPQNEARTTNAWANKMAALARPFPQRQPQTG